MPEPPAYPGPEALEQVIRTERPKLVRIACRILRDQHEAEDVVQSTLTIVWSRADALAPLQLQAYLHRAVELNALKMRSRRTRGVSLNHEDQIAAKEDLDAPLTIDPFELEKGIADLPLSQQVILRLRFYTGLSFRQISENLKISQNTAASRCRYAVAKLKEYFKTKRR